MKKSPARQLRRAIVSALIVFAGSVLSISGYTLWRLRAESVVNGFEIAAMHSRSFEELLTQSLHVTELLTAATLEQALLATSPEDVAGTIASTLRRAPHLRSMSLLGADGRILASSNPANVGLVVQTESYLPHAQGAHDLLRIGQPWSGRDFAVGQPSSATVPADAKSPGFIPVVQTLTVDTRTVRLLVALNPDYFINHMMQKLQGSDGIVEVLRYDGVLIMSTDPAASPGGLPEYVMRDLHLGESESGRIEQTMTSGARMLTAFRASPLYPVVIVTQIRSDFALRHWQAEAGSLLTVVVLTLSAIGVLAWAYYRRQLVYLRERIEAERLQRINATVFDASTEAMLITDVDTVVISINQAFTRVTGYAPVDVIGQPLFSLLVRDTLGDLATAIKAPTVDETVPAPASKPLEAALICKDGEPIWTEILSTPERDAKGRVVGYHRICRDISDRKQMEDQIRQLAFYDPLTQLANRRLMSDRLEQAMAASKRTGRYGALMFLDLDKFKPLNDEHGHEVGDLLLLEVALRLRQCVREIDTVARFGGDEFVVMLSALSPDYAESLAQARVIAEKIRAALAMPYQLRARNPGKRDIDVRHQCSASIGVVLFERHTATQGEVINRADAAMYRAKDAGRNQIVFHAVEAPVAEMSDSSLG